MHKVKLTGLQVAAGARIPHGFGVAWHRSYEDAAIILPIPLNIIVGAVVRLYWWARAPFDKAELQKERTATRSIFESSQRMAEMNAKWIERYEKAMAEVQRLEALLEHESADARCWRELQRLVPMDG